MVLQDGKRRYLEAVARKKIRLDRSGFTIKSPFCSLYSFLKYRWLTWFSADMSIFIIVKVDFNTHLSISLSGLIQH